MAQVRLDKIAGPTGVEDPGQPKLRAPSVADAGMGDLLRFDAERLRILIERHLAYTGSGRAKALLDDWDRTRTQFVKVMPLDYARALSEMKTQGASAVAAE
jgi:glutamate synthase (NADPH/NADH) large chain